MKSNHSLKFALLLGAFSALGPFTFDMYLPSFPDIMRFFDTSASMVQVSLTASLLGVGIGQIMMGPLSDVHGRRKPLFFAMIAFLLTSFACAFAPNIYVFIGLRFLQGFAASAGMVISRAIVRDSYDGVELTKFFALLTLIGNLAPLLAPIAGSAVLSFGNWIGVFIFLGLLGVFLTVITQMGVKESLPVEKRVPSDLKGLVGNFKGLLKDRPFMGYALSQGVMVAGIFAYLSGTPFIYQKIYGVSPTVFSILFALNGIALMIGSRVVSSLAGKWSDRQIFQLGLTVALFASIGILLAVLFKGPLFTIVVPLFFFVGSCGISGPTSFTLAMESQGHMAGSAAALLGVIPFLLGSVTSPLVGIAGEYSAVPFGAIIFTVSVLAMIINIILIRNSQVETAPKKVVNQ